MSESSVTPVPPPEEVVYGGRTTGLSRAPHLVEEAHRNGRALVSAV